VIRSEPAFVETGARHSARHPEPCFRQVPLVLVRKRMPGKLWNGGAKTDRWQDVASRDGPLSPSRTSASGGLRTSGNAMFPAVPVWVAAEKGAFGPAVPGVFPRDVRSPLLLHFSGLSRSNWRNGPQECAAGWGTFRICKQRTTANVRTSSVAV